MKPPDLREVSAGLSVSQIGSRFVAAAVLVTALTAAVQSLDHGGERWGAFFIILGGGCCTSVLAGVGTLITFTGRVRCLDTPPELPFARSRIRLAVILDGCGLLSGVVNLIVAAVYSGSGTVPLEVLWAAVGLSLVLLVAGRVFFLAYLLALARVVDHPVTFRPPIPVVMAIVSFVAVVAAVVGICLTEDPRKPPTVGGVMTAGGSFAGVAVVLAGLYVYDRLLRRVREAVERFTFSMAITGEPEAEGFTPTDTP